MARLHQLLDFHLHSLCYRLSGKVTWAHATKASRLGSIPNRAIPIRVTESSVKYPTPTFQNFRLLNIKGMKFGNLCFNKSFKRNCSRSPTGVLVLLGIVVGVLLLLSEKENCRSPSVVRNPTPPRNLRLRNPDTIDLKTDTWDLKTDTWVLGVHGWLLRKAHAPRCDWLATSAASTAKEATWHTAQASGGGRHSWRLRKKYLNRV